MKIAIASPDGSHVSAHFGRSSHFLVIDVENGKVVGKELRANPFAGHGGGGCHGEGHNRGDAVGHRSMVTTLHDCNAVLCYGMGAGAAEALNQSGSQPYLLGKRCTAEDAVVLFLEGKLAPLTQGHCHCHE